MKQGVVQAIMISNLFWARNHSLRSLVVFWIPIFKHFQSKAVFAHLCLEVRSYTASWYRAYLLCQTPESKKMCRIERADASHWIVCYTFFCLRCKRMDQMLHLQHHGTDLCLEAACGSWKACIPGGTERNWRKLICSTVRLERLFVTNMQNQYVRLERLFVTNMQNQ